MRASPLHKGNPENESIHNMNEKNLSVLERFFSFYDEKRIMTMTIVVKNDLILPDIQCLKEFLRPLLEMD